MLAHGPERRCSRRCRRRTRRSPAASAAARSWYVAVAARTPASSSPGRCRATIADPATASSDARAIAVTSSPRRPRTGGSNRPCQATSIELRRPRPSGGPPARGFASRSRGSGRSPGRRPCPSRVEPGSLEVDALVLLDREVALVGFLELLARDADEARVDIHELSPCRFLRRSRAADRRRVRVTARWLSTTTSVIGHLTDERAGGRTYTWAVTAPPNPRLPDPRRAGRPARPRRPADRGGRRRPAVSCCCSPARPASARRGCSARSSGRRARRGLPDRSAAAPIRATSRSRPRSSSTSLGRWLRVDGDWRTSAGRSPSGSRTAAPTASDRTSPAAAARPRHRGAPRRDRSAMARSIVALEDLHWSDDLTLEILEALARRLGGPAAARRRDLPERRALPARADATTGERGCSASARPRKSASRA